MDLVLDVGDYIWGYVYGGLMVKVSLERACRGVTPKQKSHQSSYTWNVVRLVRSFIFRITPMVLHIVHGASL